jgi:hypothetical protein
MDGSSESDSFLYIHGVKKKKKIKKIKNKYEMKTKNIVRI